MVLCAAGDTSALKNAPSVNQRISLVFEEDVEYIGLVLEVLRVFEQLGQSAVIDGAASVSGDATLWCDRHVWSLEGGEWSVCEDERRRAAEKK